MSICRTSGNAYLRHPDSYLPQFNVPSETEGESSSTEVFSKATSEMLPRRKLSGKCQTINYYIFVDFKKVFLFSFYKNEIL